MEKRVVMLRFAIRGTKIIFVPLTLFQPTICQNLFILHRLATRRSAATPSGNLTVQTKIGFGKSGKLPLCPVMLLTTTALRSLFYKMSFCKICCKQHLNYFV